MTLFADDPVLGPLVEEHGPLPVEPADDPFERLVVSIVNQQLSTTAAATIRDRLFDAIDVTPAGILAADDAVLRDAGLSAQKATYVKSAAEAFVDGDLDREAFAAMSDEQVIEELTAIHGIGPWSAKTFCMFALGRQDVFPVEDLGIRRGMERLFGDLSRTEMVDRADAWRPHRSVASLYVWRAADT